MYSMPLMTRSIYPAAAGADTQLTQRQVGGCCVLVWSIMLIVERSATDAVDAFCGTLPDSTVAQGSACSRVMRPCHSSRRRFVVGRSLLIRAQ